MLFGLLGNDGNMVFDRVWIVNMFDENAGEPNVVELPVLIGSQFEFFVECRLVGD